MKKVAVKGGGISHSAGLQAMQPANPERNWEYYSNWADSVRSFPSVIKQKVNESRMKYKYDVLFTPYAF